MGNLLQCCLRHLFQCKDIPDQTEEESPLLSRENSDVESLSPSRSDMLASPVLDQDHLLYPDIVLSSSHRANLDRADLSQQLEIVLPERGQNKKQTSVKDERHEGFEDAGTPSTRISQQEFCYLDRNQLCTTEKEWPLLSSLQSWPSEQSNAAKFASQTLIYTQGQGTRYWQASPCQGMQVLAQGNGSHQGNFSEPKSAGTISTPSAKVSTQTETDNVRADEDGIQDEDKEEAQLGKGTEQMELSMVHRDQNVAQLGQRAKYVFRSVAECEQSGVCPDEIAAQLDEVGVKINLDLSNQMEHYPDQSGQIEAQYRQNVAQTDKVRHETVILISENGEHKEPTLVTRLQANPDIERNQEEITQTQQLMLELDSVQTEGDSTEMNWVAAHKEQNISGNEPEFANKQGVIELRSFNEEQDGEKSEEMDQDKIHPNLDRGPEQNEQFTLFVVDKLFLATPSISGLCLMMSFIKNKKAPMEVHQMYVIMESTIDLCQYNVIKRLDYLHIRCFIIQVNYIIASRTVS